MMTMMIAASSACADEMALNGGSNIEVSVSAPKDQSSLVVGVRPFSYGEDLSPEDFEARCRPLEEDVIATVGGVRVPRTSSGGLVVAQGLSFCFGAEFKLERNVPRLDVSTLSIDVAGGAGKVHFETGTFCANRRLALAGSGRQFRRGQEITFNALLPDSDEFRPTFATFGVEGKELKYVNFDGSEQPRRFRMRVPAFADPGLNRIELTTKPLIGIRECTGAGTCVADCEEDLTIYVDVLSN